FHLRIARAQTGRDIRLAFDGRLQLRHLLGRLAFGAQTVGEAAACFVNRKLTQPKQGFQRIVRHSGSSASRSAAKLSPMVTRSVRSWRNIASIKKFMTQ